MPYESVYKKKLDKIKQENRYREFITLSRVVGNLPYAIWHSIDDNFEKEVVVWCTNDYLGMSHHPKVVDAFKEGALTYGIGSGGTRNISGTVYPHIMLEKQVAELHGKEAGLLFSSGYAANEGTLSTLSYAFENLVIFSDEKNHASIIQGIRAGNAQKHVFPHNDITVLEHLLGLYPLDHPKLIVVTSVYSMHGDFAPLEKLCELSKKYNALLYVDEVHAVGLYGEHGGGLSEHLGVADQIDIIQGNFAKGYGVIGGYIAGTASLVDYVRSSASNFIFTTSMPPALAIATCTSIKYLMENNREREILWENVDRLKKLLEKTDIPYIKNDGHIVAVTINNALDCKNICQRLIREYGIYVQPINYPTVKRGEEMIRLTITPFHTKSMIYELIHALQEVIYKPSDATLKEAA
jgi:5-aminolevulinate synthase